MITLVCGDSRWTVSVERAESILKIQKAIGGDWQLPDTHEQLRDGTIVRRIKTAGRVKAVQKGDSKRDVAPESPEVPHADDTNEG